jgi:excisionase family DNA binding protein
MITTAWTLGGGGLAPVPTKGCRWAHMLGYGGHFLTKSRRYSITFGQLRNARAEHRRQQRQPEGERDPCGRPLDETIVLILLLRSPVLEEPEPLLTVAQVAELLATTERFPRRLIAERRIRFIRVGRHIRVPESALGDEKAAPPDPSRLPRAVPGPPGGDGRLVIHDRCRVAT